MLGIDTRIARYTWSAVAAPLGICALYLVRRTLFVFVVALMFAYLLYPLVDGLERRSRKRRTSALVLPFVLILGLMGAFGVYLGGRIEKEAAQFASRSASLDFAKQVKEWSPLGIPIGEQIAGSSRELLLMVPQLQLGGRLLSVSRGLIDLLIVPILSFLILKDGRRIRDSLLEILDSHRAVVEGILMDAHNLMLQYMRALLILCIITLISFSVALSLLGVHYAILLASLAFMLEFVPMAGPLISAVVIVAVSHFRGYSHPLWWVVAFLGVYRIFLDYVVAPHLMRKGVELHPLLILFGVFAGGEIGGIAGIFLSVPVLALLRLLYYESRKRRVAPRELHLETVLCAGGSESFAEKRWA